MKDNQEEARNCSFSSLSSTAATTTADVKQQDACGIFSLLYPFVDESKAPLPRCWSSKDKYQLLSLTHSDLRVHYKGQGKSHKDAAAVRSTSFIPAACGLYYFEVRIVNKGRDGLFGIGLSQAGVSLNRLPGWDKFSYGYHGDDGHSFSFSGSGVPYGPIFSTGDVIGCGLNLVENYCFYTKNGFNIGVAFTDLPADLYPTVGLQTPGEVVEANFGQYPFVYDIFEEIKMAQQRIRGSIETYCLPLNKTDYFNKLVSSYLVHHGYSETAESFNKLTDQTCKEDFESIKCREKILKLIMNGRIGEATRQVHHAYPDLLERNKNLLFLLKCRQFVEMVAGNDEVGCLPPYDPSLLRHYSALASCANKPFGSWSPSARRSPSTKKNPAYTPPHRTAASLTPRDSPRDSPRSCALASYVSVNGAVAVAIACRSKSASVSPARRNSDASRNGAAEQSSANGCSAAVDVVENACSPDSLSNGCSNGNAAAAATVAVVVNDASVIGGQNGQQQRPPTPTDCDVEMNELVDDEVMSVDSNVALVHFGRELHQLGLQIVNDQAGEPGGECGRLKMMQDAFSLMAYTDPWKSPLCGQLMPEQRESVAATLNSFILESRGFAAKPPLEVIFGHAQKLRDEMIKVGLGAAAFTDPLYYTSP